MTPMLEMMTAFAAAALPTQMERFPDNPNEACREIWDMAGRMMVNMPKPVREELEAATAVYDARHPLPRGRGHGD